MRGARGRGRFSRMKRSNLSAIACSSVLGLSALLGACKLDLGSTGFDGPSDKAKVSAADGGTADSQASASDASADGGAGSTSTTASPDGGAGSETGTSTNALHWGATPPPGERVILDVAGDQACSFELAYIVENPGAPQQQYSTTLEKKDVAPGSCPDAKGFVVLSEHSYADPAGVVRRHSTDPIIAVAWTEKASADVTVPNLMRLAQIDWKTGTDLHEGIMMVKGAAVAEPVALRPTSMNLSVGYDVILSGTGDFPGAAGEGASFEATWVGFLANAPQQPAAADSATRQ